MNKSRAYLLSLSAQERKKLAKLVNPKSESFHQYLYQIGKNWKQRTPSRELAARLEKATNGKVKARDFEKEAFKKVSA